MQKPDQHPQVVVMPPSGCGGGAQPSPTMMEDQDQQQHQQRKQRPPPLMLITPRDQQPQPHGSPMSAASSTDEHHHPHCCQHQQRAQDSSRPSSTTSLCVCHHSPMSASSMSSASSVGDPRQLTPMTFSPGGQRMLQTSSPMPVSSPMISDSEDTLTSIDPGLDVDETSSSSACECPGSSVTCGSAFSLSTQATDSGRGAEAGEEVAKGTGRNGYHTSAKGQQHQGKASESSTSAPAPRRTTFGRLPDALWLRVMCLLDLYDRFQLTQTCLLFRKLFFHPMLWQRVELVCSVGALPPTKAAAVGEREEAPVCLRPSHKKIVAEFGHLFQHVRLHFADTRRNLEPETQQILSKLADKWSVRGLKLSTSFDELAVVGGPLNAARYARSGRKVAVEMVRKAKDLKYLDLSEWPIFVSEETSHFQFPPNPDLLLWDIIGAGRERVREVSEKDKGEESLLHVLTERDTCPQLTSLNVARKTFPFHGPGLEAYRLPDHALRLVAKLRHRRNLTLTLRQSMLSDALLLDLASASKDQEGQGQCEGQIQGEVPVSIRLRVVNCDPINDKKRKSQDLGAEQASSAACPMLSESAWRALKAACPTVEGGGGGETGLEVEAVAEVYHIPALRWLFQPHVPLVSVTFVSCSVPPHLLRCALQCRDTLRSLHCHILPGKGLDAALMEVAEGCGKLRHLVFYGTIHCSTIASLAALPRQWVTFSFRQKLIVLAANSDNTSACGEKSDSGHTGGTGDHSPVCISPDLPSSASSSTGSNVDLDEDKSFPPPEPSVPGNAEVGKIVASFFASPQTVTSADGHQQQASTLFMSGSSNTNTASTASTTVGSANPPHNLDLTTQAKCGQQTTMTYHIPDRPLEIIPKTNIQSLPMGITERGGGRAGEGGWEPSSYTKTLGVGKGGGEGRRCSRTERERVRGIQIDQLSLEVSRLLGYPWKPLDF